MSRSVASIAFLSLAFFTAIGDVQGAPSFAAPAKPTFQNSGEGLIKRIILKSKPLIQEKDRVYAASSSSSIKVVDVDPESDFDAALQELTNRDDVEYAVNDSILWAVSSKIAKSSSNHANPDDPDFKYQWALPRVNAPAAWMNLQGSNRQQVNVCVVDSGIDASHPDLAPNLHPMIGYNAIAKNGNVSDGLKHGTHIAGILAAVGNNGYEVAGVGANNIRVLSCKFLSDQGFGYTSSAIQCINYCLDMKADIISNSWSGDDENPALIEAIVRAKNQGVLFVVAAGNTATDLTKDTSFPASYASELPNIIVVASSDFDNKISSFSNYGTDAVHLAAPGEWILSTVPDNTTDYFSGTSMSAPLVAGAAALALSASNRSMSFIQVKDVLLSSVQKYTDLAGKVSSGGVLDVGRALEIVLKNH